MVQILGTYKLERNENLDEFYQKESHGLLGN